MKRYYFAFLLFTVFSYGQNKNPLFEGLITYKHDVIPKKDSVNVNYDYAGIGRTSDYYFKNGNIKWLTYDCYFKMDLFVVKENRDYWLTNLSDTIYTLKKNVPDFRIIDYKTEKTSVKILNHNCQVLTLKLKPLDKESPITYRRYYFSNDFSIDPKKFANCTSSAYDVIYGQIKSVPLRIEYEFENRIVVWEATAIKPMKLEDSFFEISKKSVLGYW